MKVGALIPCRSGSKGIPFKNFKMFCGKPLYWWTLDAAKDTGIFDKIILSSDGGFDPMPDGVIVDNNRPAEFATDEARLDPLLLHYALLHEDIDLWCLLQPTSPLRRAEDIMRSYEMAAPDTYDSIVSVYPEKGFYWVKDAVEFDGRKMAVATYHTDKRPNRDQRAAWFAENGAIYWTKKYAVKHSGIRCGGEVGLYVMTRENSLEIDDELDWRICEMVMRDRNGMA